MNHGPIFAARRLLTRTLTGAGVQPAVVEEHLDSLGNALHDRRKAVDVRFTNAVEETGHLVGAVLAGVRRSHNPHGPSRGRLPPEPKPFNHQRLAGRIRHAIQASWIRLKGLATTASRRRPPVAIAVGPLSGATPVVVRDEANGQVAVLYAEPPAALAGQTAMVFPKPENSTPEPPPADQD